MKVIHKYYLHKYGVRKQITYELFDTLLHTCLYGFYLTKDMSVYYRLNDCELAEYMPYMLESELTYE